MPMGFGYHALKEAGFTEVEKGPLDLWPKDRRTKDQKTPKPPAWDNLDRPRRPDELALVERLKRQGLSDAQILTRLDQHERERQALLRARAEEKQHGQGR